MAALTARLTEMSYINIWFLLQSFHHHSVFNTHLSGVGNMGRPPMTLGMAMTLSLCTDMHVTISMMAMTVGGHRSGLTGSA